MATDNIRQATRDDIPSMLTSLRKHHAEHSFAWPFDRVRLSILCAHAISAPDWLALTGAGALLLARWFDCEFGSGRHAVERVVRVPAGGIDAMLTEYEQWARDSGCVDVTLGCVRRHATFARLYARKGYAVAETTFVKAL